MPGPQQIEALIDQAVAALNRGELEDARALADQVLTTDADNVDAREVRSAVVEPNSELRRLTVVFCDLVGSTELSSRLEPDAYHSVLQRYQTVCRATVEDRFGGTIISYRGDGILAAFGYPTAHEDDVDRAVQAALDLLAGIDRLSSELEGDLTTAVEARVAVHRGLVFLDRERRDLYGYSVNVAARLEALAEPGTLVVSDEVRALLGDRYAIETHPPREVKGVPQPLASHTVRRQQVARPLPSAGAPLVGRDHELHLLRDAWSAARSGTRARGSCVAIVGDAGMGKSRLVDAISLEAVADGAKVLALAGAPLQTGSGLWPVRRLLEERAGLSAAPAGPERVDRLRALVTDAGLDEHTVALLATLLGLDPAWGFARVEVDDRLLREQIEQAALAFLTASFGASGTVLVAEDLHWVDAATRDLLGQLIRSDDPNLLVVLASRDGSVVPRGDLTTRVQLDPLDQQSLGQLIEELGGGDLELGVQRQVAARSDGVPLFATELVRAALLDPVSPAVVFGRLTEPVAGVPEVLYQPLVARLNVAPHVMELAATAATIGRDVDRQLLARSCDLPRPQQEDALQVLLATGILEPHPVMPDTMRFHHELLRAVVGDLQTPARHRELHRRVAEAMIADDAGSGGVDWLVLATHRREAGELPAATDAYLRASLAARRRGDLVEARDVLSQAIEMVEHSPEDLAIQEVDLRLRRGYFSVSLEGNTSAQAASDYERCLELAVATEDPGSLVSTITCLAAYYMAKGELDLTRELYGAMAKVTGPLADVARFLATTGESIASFYRGDFAEAESLAAQAIGMDAAFDRADAYDRWFFVPLHPRATNHGTLSIARFFMGDIAGWDTQAQASRAVCELLPFPSGAFTLTGMMAFEVWLAVELGDPDLAASVLDEMDANATRYGFDQWAIVATTARELAGGLDAARAGAPSEEIARVAHTLGGYLAMWKMVDQWVFLTYYLTRQGELFAAAGEMELARAAFEESLATGERTRMRFYDVETLRHLANLADDPAERTAGLHAALELAHRQKAVFFELRVADDLAQLTGDDEPLRRAVEKFPASSSFAHLDAARALVG